MTFRSGVMSFRSGVMTSGSGVPTLRSGLLRSVWDAIVAVLLAPACAACRKPLDRPTRGVVCEGCWNAIALVRPGEEMRAQSGQAATLSAVRAVGLYEGSLRGIVHALKYDGRRSVARRLGGLMREHAADVLCGADAVVPVPLHRRRQRARGFNQAAELGGHLGLPVCHALRRVRSTPSQTDLPADERHANVRGAFAPARRVDVRGRCLVLVDDVTTTGATLEACARVLRDAGAREVRAVTAALVASRPR